MVMNPLTNAHGVKRGIGMPVMQTYVNTGFGATAKASCATQSTPGDCALSANSTMTA